MKIWTDKQGNKLTAKEFMNRWKQGIERITPLQQTKNQIRGYYLIFVGIIWGIVYTFNSAQWWLFIILLGSGLITFMQYTTVYQKLLILKKLEGGVNES